MSKVIMEITKETYDILLGLHCFFDNYDSAICWLEAKNHNFGGIAPIELINRGRAHKVQQFINTALDENRPLRGLNEIQK